MISVSNIIIMLLSIFSIALLSLTLFLPESSELYKLLTYFDFILCLIFLYDFLHQLLSVKEKWKYMHTIGWLDLLSSIPVVSELRYIRVFRIFRIFRIIKSIRLLIEFIKENKANSLYGFVVFSAFTTLVICTTAILYVEQEVGNIKTAEDALWWSFITITTVGYGDFYPVTNVGRLITVVLIIAGVATFGAAISYIGDKTQALKK
ncbi:MAG: ion channel [Flavobacteriaceae bacterium]|nr:two pore domain potassium channel family protein [Flavobacteriaceae bacterium]